MSGANMRRPFSGEVIPYLKKMWTGLHDLAQARPETDQINRPGDEFKRNSGGTFLAGIEILIPNWIYVAPLMLGQR
jgi:hypothetical protein